DLCQGVLPPRPVDRVAPPTRGRSFGSVRPRAIRARLRCGRALHHEYPCACQRSAARSDRQPPHHSTTFANWREPEVKISPHPEIGGAIAQTVHPKTYHSLSASDLQVAGDAWFFRKVAASCACDLVLERIRSPACESASNFDPHR